MKPGRWILVLAAVGVTGLAAIRLSTAVTSSDQATTTPSMSITAETSGSGAVAGLGDALQETEAGIQQAEGQSTSVQNETEEAQAVQSDPGSAAGGTTQSTADSRTDTGSDSAESALTEASAEPEEQDDWTFQTEEETEEDTETKEDSGTAEDIWSGTYIGDQDSVTLQAVSQDEISFSFRESGISGTAKIENGQAVYEGDDENDVVFAISGTVLTVSVSSREDYDTSGSPLNGDYIRSE